MKTKIYIITFMLFVSVVSCKKNDKIPNSGISIDEMDGRISTVTNNMQTKYSTFASAATVQGNFKTALGINSFLLGDFNVGKTSTGMFFGETAVDSILENKFSTFYGKSLQIKLNGEKILNIPAVPYANVIEIGNDLNNWTISKSKGMVLKWKIRNLSYTSIPNSRLDIDNIDLPQQVAGSKTVIAIVPDDLKNTNAKSLYWVVDDNAQTFTIIPSVLSGFNIGEKINLTLGSGTNHISNINGYKIDILSLNTTSLPSVEVIP